MYVRVCECMYIPQVFQKVEATDPSASRTRAITEQIKTLCLQNTSSLDSQPASSSSLSAQHKWQLQLAGVVAAGAAVSWAYWTGCI